MIPSANPAPFTLAGRKLVQVALTTRAVQYWIQTGIVIGHRERYAQYEAWWLDIDDKLAAKLDRSLRAQRRA
jgi:hypothetical protein